MERTTISRLIRQEFYRKRLQYRRDAIPGGLGDTAKASDFDREQVAKGIRVEMEHTSDPRTALEIALDHLSENPRYYDELAKLKLSRMMSEGFKRHRYEKFVESEHPRDEEGKFVDTDLSKKFERHELDRKSDDELRYLSNRSSNDRTKRLSAKILKDRNAPRKEITVEQQEAIDKSRNEQSIRQQSETRALHDLKSAFPTGEYRQVELRNMLSDRTPAQMRAYVDAATSWKSHDPAKSSIDFTVSTLRRAGVRLEQRGKNYSWYGMLSDGRTIRVGDHIGFEAHDIDIVFDNDRPLSRSRVEQWVAEELKDIP